MKDPMLKVAIVVWILASWVLVSKYFPRSNLLPKPPEPSVEEVILMRCQAEEARKQRELEAKKAASRSENGGFRAFAQAVPLPSLPADYPGVKQADAHSQKAGEFQTSSVKLPNVPSHIVVDGDTLASLAERYLGSASRASEIFEANRDRLQNPSLLPINVELKIPPVR